MHFVNRVQRLSSFPLCSEIIKAIVKVELQESEKESGEREATKALNIKSKISKDPMKISLSICDSLGVTQ